MQTDKSREKSLYFLLLAVARQLKFENPNQILVREAIKNISVVDNDEDWIISTNVNGEHSQISVHKENFKFYQTRDIDQGSMNPADKNKQSAINTLLSLFEPFGFTSKKTKTSNKNELSPKTFIFRLLFIILGLVLIQINEFEAPNKLMLFSILIVVILNLRMKWAYEDLIYLLLAGIATYFVAESNKVNFQVSLISLYFASFHILKKKYYVNLRRPGRIITLIMVSVFYFLTANDPSEYFGVLVFFLAINELFEIQIRERRQFLLLTSTFSGFCILVTLGVLNGNLSIIKILVVVGFEIYLVFFGKAQSMSRFLLPPALLLLL
jgi:hypothetical protein